jgi:hypothetical protein
MHKEEDMAYIWKEILLSLEKEGNPQVSNVSSAMIM